MYVAGYQDKWQIFQLVCKANRLPQVSYTLGRLSIPKITGPMNQSTLMRSLYYFVYQKCKGLGPDALEFLTILKAN